VEQYVGRLGGCGLVGCAGGFWYRKARANLKVGVKSMSSGSHVFYERGCFL